MTKKKIDPSIGYSVALAEKFKKEKKFDPAEYVGQIKPGSDDNEMPIAAIDPTDEDLEEFLKSNGAGLSMSERKQLRRGN